MAAILPFQSPPRPMKGRNVAFAALVAFLTLGAVGNSDYADAIDTWTEEKLARPKRAAKPDPAVIWSQRCARKGKQLLAKQGDGGKWQISCVNATLKFPHDK